MTQSMRVICCFRRRSMLSATSQRQPSAAHRTAVQTFYSATAEAHTATDSVINSYHVSRWRLTVPCGRHRLSIGNFDSACFYKQRRAFCLMRQHRGRQTTTIYGPTTPLKKAALTFRFAEAMVRSGRHACLGKQNTHYAAVGCALPPGKR